MTTETTKTTYREPGQGAIDFATQFVVGLTREQAKPIIEQLLAGNLHDKTDKRIKRCEYCGYYYRDKTRPNNSKTCSRECKIAKDTLIRAKKNADKALIKPIEKEIYSAYTHWLEYPFYFNEHYMLKHAHDRENPFEHDKLAQIDAARQRGYKRKTTGVIGKVHVRGLRHRHLYGAVKISRNSREEIDEYFINKYGAYKLRMERRRAKQFSRSKKSIDEEQ
jgi:hypothetical protein